MKWEDYLKTNVAEKRVKDTELAKSLFDMASKRFDFFCSKEPSVFVLEGVYESIMELCQSLLASQGFKTYSHECVIEFLRSRYLDDSEMELLHGLRKKRNQIKYYGKTLSTESIKINIETGKSLFMKLKPAVKKTIG